LRICSTIRTDGKQQHEHDEHADDRNGRQHDDQPRWPLLALELAAVLDEIAFRQFDPLFAPAA
jgi:hypothetical protein